MRRIASPLIATALVAATLMAGFTDASSGLLASEDIESAPSIVTPRPDPALLIDPKPVERTVPSTPEPCDELGNRGRCGGPDRLAPEPPELVPDEISSVDDWRPLVARYFDQEDVARALAVIRCESGGAPEAKNPSSSASGLFQHLGSYWDRRTVKAGWDGADIFDPIANTAVAAWLVYEGGGWSHWNPSRHCWG